MNTRLLISALVIRNGGVLRSIRKTRRRPKRVLLNTRYSLAVIDDATFYSGLPQPLHKSSTRSSSSPPSTSAIKADSPFPPASSASPPHIPTPPRSFASKKPTLASPQAISISLTGRKMVRWGTGYAFSAAGVLDPPRDPTNPSDRLNVNQGRDMVKADYVRGPHALTLAWSSAALAPAHSTLRDTTAFRYNVLVRGFDTSLIAGNDRGGDSFGALTFTRVLGQAWEVHGEAAWREQAAVLIGAKCTLQSGVTFIGEFYTPPNTPYFRDMSVSPLAGRQHYAFFNVGKTRLRQLPGWKEWDVSGSVVANLDDHSVTGIVDVSRWFGNHFSSYVHVEVAARQQNSDFGATPYSAATSVGVRFHL